MHSSKLVRALLCALAVAAPATARAGTVSTVAGGGGPAFPAAGGFGGDGGAAISARLNRPSFAAPDGHGGYYVDDSANQRVRHVDPRGRITTVAGSGHQGFCGDGGPARRACLNMSHGLWPDGHGGLYIADTFNGRVRYVSSSGTIRTVAAGLGLPVSVRPAGGERWLITDSGAGRVLVYDARSGRTSALAGSGVAGSSGDGGPAAAAELDSPADAIAYRGGVLVADGGNCRLRWVTPAGTIRPFAGGGLPITACRNAIHSFAPPLPMAWRGDGHAATAASVLVPGYLDSDGSSVYVTDFLGGTVRRIDARGVIRTVVGTGDPPGFNGERGGSSATRLAWPSAAILDRRGQLLVTDAGNNRVRRVLLSS